MTEYQTYQPPERTFAYIRENTSYVLIDEDTAPGTAAFVANLHTLPQQYDRPHLRYPQAMTAVVTWEHSGNEYTYSLSIPDTVSPVRHNDVALQNITETIERWVTHASTAQFRALTTDGLLDWPVQELTERFAFLHDYYNIRPEAQLDLPGINSTISAEIRDSHGVLSVQRGLHEDMPLVDAVCPACDHTWNHLIPITNPSTDTLLETLYCPICELHDIPIEYTGTSPLKPTEEPN